MSRYLGSVNLYRIKPEEARDMAIAAVTALKLGMAIEVSLPELKPGMDVDYWIPLVSFKVIPRAAPDATQQENVKP